MQLTVGRVGSLFYDVPTTDSLCCCSSFCCVCQLTYLSGFGFICLTIWYLFYIFIPQFSKLHFSPIKHLSSLIPQTPNLSNSSLTSQTPPSSLKLLPHSSNSSLISQTPPSSLKLLPHLSNSHNISGFPFSRWFFKLSCLLAAST